MTSRSPRKRTVRSAFSCVLLPFVGLPLLLLAGCGLGTPSSDSDVWLGNVQGRVMGGQIPIQGSLITLYATSAGATGYGQAATVLGTATTDASGNFVVQPIVTCPAGQQTYITAAGGYQTGQPTLVNNSVLEMAALGPCGILHNATGLVISEVTTVAAGYALQGFMTTAASSANDGTYVANVSAPAANNALPSAATPTALAGLSHAFTNAANLVNFQTGKANYNFTASYAGTTTQGTVPLVEINTLADILQSCVDGATANSNCGSIFGFMPSISNVTPANTLQAIMNLARNPYPSVAAMNATTGLLSFSNSQSAYQPKLSAVPADWSMAVTYGRTGTTTYSLPTGYWMALDANDTAYVGYATITSSTPVVYGVSTYGNTVPAFGSFSAGTSTRGVAVDLSGYLWVTNASAITGRFNPTTGGAAAYTFTSTIGSSNGLGIDKANNVWIGHANLPTMSVPTNVEELVDTGTAAGNAATGSYAVNYTASAPYGPYGMTVDANQNIWLGGYVTNGTQAIVLSNLGTTTGTGSTATTTMLPATYTTAGTAITPITTTLSGNNPKPYSVVMDASGVGWNGLTGSPSTATTGLQPVTPGSFPVTSLTAGTFVPGTTPGDRGNTLGSQAVQMMAIDGAGTIFFGDNATGSGIRIYTTNGGKVLNPTASIRGCYFSTSTVTTCSVGSLSAIYNPRQIAIDSTGSVWADDTNSTYPGLTQVIGLAAPSYPVLAVGMPGVSPGMTTATPLP